MTTPLLRRLVASEFVLEVLFLHAHQNKRIPVEMARTLRYWLTTGAGPEWVVPARGVVYRGDHTSPKRLEQDIGEALTERVGRKRVTLHLSPGSSWSYDPDQAAYHSMSGLIQPEVEVVYTASTTMGMWFDMVALYKTSKFRGLRGEREVIGLDERVSCEVQWDMSLLR